MTQAARNIHVTTKIPDLAEVAAEDPNGRLAVRTPSGIVSFFPVGDVLEARVTQAQADYLTKIEGYESEGVTSKPAYEPEVKDWIRHGDLLKKQREATEPTPTPAGTQGGDVLAILTTLLGGPGKVRELLQAGVTQQAPALAERADAELLEQQEEAARIEAARDAALGWNFQKLNGKIGKEAVAALIDEFDPAYDVGSAHPNAMLAHLGRLANDNHVLSDRLHELVG